MKKLSTLSSEELQKHYRSILEKHVVKKEGCWEWKGSKNKHGYGEIRINRKHMNASRSSWIAYKEEIPKGMYVLHICDNRECCNPEHLYLGTARDNMLDMIKKGRSNFLKGSQCPWSKINEEIVLDILDMLRNDIDTREIAKKHNISVSYISEIRLGTKWGHVGDRKNIKRNPAPNRCLNEERVREIKQKFKEGIRIRIISKEYGINETTIADIKHGRTWKQVKID